MHINEARLTATEVLRTPTLIAVANREQKLSDTMAAELAALDRAAADVVSGQPGMRGIFPTDPEWELLDALEAAAGGYRAMRSMRNGLACDANAGGMTGAIFAQALCRIARVDVCPACDLFVGPTQGHFCAQTRGDRGRALGMSASFDPVSGTVVIGQDDRDFPARALGRVILLDVGKDLSIGLVDRSVEEMGVGDLVIMRKELGGGGDATP